MIVADSGGIHRLLFAAPSHPGGHLFAVAPDEYKALRIAALCRFSGRHAGGLRGTCPSSGQRHRLELLLRVFDGLNVPGHGPATLRQVARDAVYPLRDFGSAAEWKGSPHRRQMQRLARLAKHMVSAGYRDLLQGRIAMLPAAPRRREPG